MTRRSRSNVDIDDAVLDQIRHRARALDISVTTYINALLADAVRTNASERHVLAAIERGGLAVRRQPRPIWTNVRDGMVVLDGYTMTRIGFGGPHPKFGDGWYLEGPGVEGSPHMGIKRRDAEMNANAIIESLALHG